MPILFRLIFLNEINNINIITYISYCYDLVVYKLLLFI